MSVDSFALNGAVLPPAAVPLDSMRSPDDFVSPKAYAALTDFDNLALTDSTNAERFAAFNNSDVRYVENWKEWIVWDGKRWRRDSYGQVFIRIRDAARTMRAEAAQIDNRDESERRFRHALKSESSAASRPRSSSPVRRRLCRSTTNF